MAWLHNLAGKAENLLNRIDQNAAVVLNEPITTNELSDNIQNLHTSSSVPNLNYYGNDTNATSTSYSETQTDISVSELDSSNVMPEVNSQPVLEKLDTSVRLNETVPNKIDESSQFIENETGSLQENDNDDVNEPPTIEPSLETSGSGSRNASVTPQDASQQHVKYEERINSLENENGGLHKQLLNVQHICGEMQNANGTLQIQLDRATESVQTARLEMEQYRARAQKILQEKERLIALRQEVNETNAQDVNLNETLSAYNDELKQELNVQQEKNTELSNELLAVTNDLSLLREQQQTAQQDVVSAHKSLQESLVKERTHRHAAEEDAQTRTEQLQLAMQEISQQRRTIKQKHKELVNVQEQMKQRAQLYLNDEHGNRLQSLTETLLTKQNAISNLTTERNALRLQLEKLQTDHGNVLIQLKKTQSKIIHMNDTDDVKAQVPQFLVMSPFDVGMTKRVKNVYSSLDALSIRTGVFLRRYPLARIFVLCYMVLLHIWVVIILFTYIPSTSK